MNDSCVPLLSGYDVVAGMNHCLLLSWHGQIYKGDVIMIVV